jgi:hypothetical protein
MHNGAERYRLSACPFNPDHGPGKAVVLKLASGALVFKCQSDSCSKRKWQDVRALVDGPRETRASSRNEDLGETPDESRPGNGAVEGGEKVTATKVVQTFQKWLYLPDPGVVYVPLGAVAANLMEGDPVWVMIVGPSSGGKTEIIVAVVHLPYVRLGATLTEPALLSGTPQKQRAAGSKGGLLREIGAFGILALKDFTSVLAMHRDKRAELLAALREIFDGSWTRNVGTDGGRTLTWSGKLGLIAGCTAAIDSYHGVMAVMGERFLLYRLPTTDPIQQAKQALANTGRVRAMREELAAAVTGLFAGLDIQKLLSMLSKPRNLRRYRRWSLAPAVRLSATPTARER